jgi:hypothetical protein
MKRNQTMKGIKLGTLALGFGMAFFSATTGRGNKPVASVETVSGPTTPNSTTPGYNCGGGD